MAEGDTIEGSSTTRKRDIIDKEGYLQKQSLYFHALRQRWMVLKGSKLYSYKIKKQYKNPTEVIDLTQFEAVLVSKQEEGGGHFELISKDNKKRLFVCSSNEELEEWMLFLKPLVKQRYDIKPIRDRQTYDLSFEDDKDVFGMYVCTRSMGTKYKYCDI